MIDPRRLCQIEIQASDVKRSLSFYEDAFGWRPVPADIHEIVVLDVPRDCPFGISIVPPRNLGPGPRGAGSLTLYFAVDDPEDVVRRVEAAGGRKRFGPMSLLGYGKVYQVEDPDGTRFGLYVKDQKR